MSSLNLDEILRLMDSMPKPPRDPLALHFGAPKLWEIPESITHPPKIQLSADAPVSDKFRAEMNAWLVEQFGYRHPRQAFITPWGVLMDRRSILAINATT